MRQDALPYSLAQLFLFQALLRALTLLTELHFERRILPYQLLQAYRVHALLRF